MSLKYKLILFFTAISSGFIGACIAVTPPIWGNAVLIYLPQVGPVIIGLTAIGIAFYNTAQERKERNRKRRAIRLGMITELKTCADVATHRKDIHEKNMDLDAPFNAGVIKLYRPVFENLGSDVSLLNTKVIKAISENERVYANGVDTLEWFIDVYMPAERDKQSCSQLRNNYLPFLQDFIKITNEYIKALEGSEVSTNK